MPDMKTIRFPGSNTVFETVDAAARSRLSTLEGVVGALVDDTLSEAGKAADALATSQAITNAENRATAAAATAIAAIAPAVAQNTTDIGDLKSATTALETYVRDMSPVAYGNDEGIPVPIVTVRDAAPLNAEDVFFEVEPVQEGSGDPSPDNVRPITGWTEAEVHRTGKNLFNPSNAIKGYVNTSAHIIASSANARTVYAPCKPNTTYTISKTAGSRFIVAETAEEPGVNVVTDNIVAKNTTSSITITTSTTARYLAAFVWLSTTDVRISANDMLASVQIELGSTATDYEPYQGNTFDIAFPSEAGTVYGGTLDVVNGVLTVDRAMVDLGTLSWTKDANRTGVFYTGNVPMDVPYIGFAKICSKFKVNNSANANSIANGELSSLNSYGSSRLFVNDTACAELSASEFKAAMSGVQLVYQLDTSITYNLTPQEIEMFKGVNNLWANTGDISVQYRQDVYTALNNKINALEALVLENMN